MNPLTVTARSRAARERVARIRGVWPDVTVRWNRDQTEALVLREAGRETYLVVVTPDGARSLYVDHVPPDSPQWHQSWGYVED